VSAGAEPRPSGAGQAQSRPRRVFQKVKLTEEVRERLRKRAAELGVSVPRLLVESALEGGRRRRGGR